MSLSAMLFVGKALAASCSPGNYWSGYNCSPCVAGNFCIGFSNISSPVTGYGMRSCIGRSEYSTSGAITCMLVDSGFYSVGCNSAGNKCTNQDPCTGTAYCAGGVRAECPDAKTHARTSFPAHYYNPVLESTGVTSSNGRSSLSQCRVSGWYASARGKFYEYATYNTTTTKYENTALYGWSDSNAGYYLTNKSGCGSYAYYLDAKECPAGSYCPGKSRVACNSSNQATVHTEDFGLVSCPAKYPNSAPGSTDLAACYLTTTAGKYVATAGAGEVDCAAGGACPGGVKVYYSGTGGRTACTAGTFAAAKAASCASCAGRAKYSAAGAGACSTVSAGYYSTGCNAAGNNCTGQAQCTGATYCSGGVSANCPDVVKHVRTSFPANYYNPVMESTNIVTGAGKSNISQCRVFSWHVSPRGRLYEYANYNTGTGKYEDTVSYGWSSVTAGYYLTNKSTCGTYAYYLDAKECITGSYCPGKNQVVCNPSNQATVHTKDFGLVSCPAKYPKSAANSNGLGACYLTTTAGKYVATAGAGEVDCAAGGACPGGTNVYSSGTGGRTACTAGTFSAAKAASCTGCAGRTKYSAAGASACGTVSAGYYSTGCNAAGNNCTGQSQCTGATYCTGGVSANCPDAKTHVRTSFPAEYYNPVMESTNIVTGAGKSNISQCRVFSWHASKPGKLYEYATYNTTTGKYEDTVVYNWADAGAGYYLTNKSGCGSYAYYREVKECPANSYCPGKSRVLCDATNEATVHTEHFGLESCPAGYIADTSIGKKARSDCKINCSNGTRVAAATATCSSPAGGWYTVAHVVSFGQISQVYYCTKGFVSNSTAATGHDSVSDCVNNVAAGGYIPNSNVRARYIKLLSEGNTHNTGTHVVEIQAFGSGDGTGTNLLRSKPDITGKSSNPNRATDNNWHRGGYTTCGGGVCVWDMGSVNAIGSLKFSMYSDGRTYYKLAVYTSTDNVNWTQVFGPANVLTNNIETSTGEVIILSSVRAECSAGSISSAHAVAQGQTSSCVPCQGGKTTSAAGKGSCDADCPNKNSYASAWTTAVWNNDNTVNDMCRINGCAGGYYSNGNAACAGVGGGYYSAAGAITRTACPVGLTTFGSGAGADEIGDCGRKLRFGNDILYLRSTKKTTPSLAIGIGSTTFYGNMSVSQKGKLRINSGGTKYSVYDDSM
jgi:hypothetical protein